MKKIVEFVKTFLIQSLSYIKYDYFLSVWRLLSRLKMLGNFIKKYSGLVRRLLFVLISATVGFLIIQLDAVSFTQDILSNYLFAAAAMAGGTIAIVFTISIFLLQNASDLYSSQYFEIYIHDWKEKFVYFVVIFITILLFGFGLFAGGSIVLNKDTNSLIIFLSLIFIGVVFALIDWQYKNVRKKISPVQAIYFLESEGVRFLKNVNRDAKKIAHIIKLKSGEASEAEATAATYNQFLQPLISRLDGQLENLFEISSRLSSKQEIGTVKRGLDAVFKILVTYFEARRDSSVAIPAGIAFLSYQSDSQSFLSRNFERLNKIGEKFIEENKEDLSSYVVDVYRTLAIKAVGIEFIGGRGENPIFDSIVGYLISYVEFGKKKQNIEVVFQGARVVGDMAKLSAAYGFDVSLKTAQEKILDFAIFGLSQKQTVIIDRCSLIYLDIIAAIFNSTKIIRRHHFDDSLKNVAKISEYIDMALKSGFLSNDISSRFSISKGYDSFDSVISIISRIYSSVQNSRDKSSYRSDLLEFFEEFNSSLRELSEKIKNCDSYLVDSVARALFNVNELIVELIENQEFLGEKTKLERILSWNVHLPSFFVSYAEKIDNSSSRFNELTDCVSKTGILASERLGNKKIVSDCIESLYSITKQSIEKVKDGYGYTEPRVLEKACYLGILALKKGWRDVVTDIGLMIYEFEKSYFKKYLSNLPDGIDPMNHNHVIGLPHHDQLLRELWRWQDDYDRMPNRPIFRDDPGTMMYEFIKDIDIDRFIFDIWGCFTSGSEIENEIELKPARKRLIRVLNSIASLNRA